jgi:hypothetical protein
LLKKLIASKKKLADEHFAKTLEAHTKILKQVDGAMRSYQTKGGGDFSVLQKIKGAFSFDRSKVLNIPPEEMLSYSKAWFKTAREDLNSIMHISTQNYASLQEKINKQIDVAQQELERVEQELRGARDGGTQSWLDRKKKKIVDRSLQKQRKAGHKQRERDSRSS